MIFKIINQRLTTWIMKYVSNEGLFSHNTVELIRADLTVCICIRPLDHFQQLGICGESMILGDLKSTKKIILCQEKCSHVPLIVSPSSLATRFRFRSEIFPVRSSSNKLNTLCISSLVSLSLWRRKS